MAALTSTSTPVQHMIQHERFTTEQHGYRLLRISLGLSGNIAVSGIHNNSRRTFIDLYFGCYSDSRDKLKLFYSKEFEKYSNYSDRYVSFLDKNGSELLVTCIGDKIEIIDTKNESKVLRSCRVNGETRCLAVREGEIFIGLYESHTVIVFNNDLKETKKIKLKGIQDGDWAWDLQVIKDTIFVSTVDKSGMWSKAYSVSERDGSNVTQYTDSTGKHDIALSITVSERLRLVSVLWSKSPSKGIIVYSLNENKSFLVFNVDSNVYRIRISDRDRMIITGNWQTGEIKMYDLDQLFSFETMKRTLAYIVSPDECEELRKYFGITEKELSKRGVGDKSKKLSDEEKTMKKMVCLLTIIEEKGHLNPYNINYLTNAVSSLGDEMHVSNLKGPIEGYELNGNFQLKCRDLKAEMSANQKAWEDERNALITELEAANSKAEEQEKTLDNLQGELVHLKKQYEEQENTFRASRTESTKEIERLTGNLEETNQSLDLSRTGSARKIATLTDEIARIKTESTKDIERLTEEVKETKKSLDLSRIESNKNIETLTEELEHTQMKYTNEIETLTEELKQTKQSKAESVRQIETMTEELTQIRRESTEKIERLTEELEHTKESLNLTRIECNKNIETLTEELQQTQMKFTKEIEELTQMRRESTEKMKKLTEELEQTRKKSTKEIEELTQMRRESTEKIERSTDELKQTKQSKAETTQQIETLTAELNETKEKLVTRIKELGTANEDLEVTKQVLQETKQDRDITRTELKQYQLDFAKESKALKEVLNQTKEAMAELQKRTVEDTPSVDSEQTGDEGVSVLAAEYGRLTVAIAEHLTLDQCIQLALLFNIPASDCDTVLRLSLIESPGIKFLDVLKKRQVINMFDVTNLQKGLTMLHLDAVNHYQVVPYQDGIDKEHYELYKVKEMFTWEDVNASRISVKDDTARRQVIDSQTSLEDNTEPDNTSQTEATAQQSETGEEERRSLLRGKHHQLYIEHSIGREGGTIQLANVSLTVPPDALHESHVIALSVMNESPFPLDREVDTARMTPLIKLEPLGLMFKKSLQLNIPHSALIPEPENHDVIIYSGHISKNIEDSSDSITWIEERSISRELKEKSVTVDIQCLSYLSASLVSQTTAPPLYIVRAVPFVDGVRNTDDDITLTICFCSDNDSEYNMLLRDYKTKLRLEQYSTLQLRRHSERDEDDAGFLSVTVTSVNNMYVPDAEQTVKKFPVSHLCTASRVSHQLRLNKNQDTDRDVVDIMLTFSQAQYGPTKISLKARIKDLIISLESEKLLTGSIPPGNKIYEEMVVNISSSFDKEHCRELATYFELTSEDTEMITSNQDPGKMLMKTLEERSVIDSQKMILFFEGLKACHLDEIAKLVSEYTSEISKQTQEKEQKPEEDEKTEETEEGTRVSQQQLKQSQRNARSSLNDQWVQTTLSSSCVSSDVHVKTLTKEGYIEHEVVEALDISRNRLVMARKVLQFLGEQLDVPSTKDFIFLHKEQYIDENGGEITLREANVHLLIPVGAVTKGNIVSLTMMTNKQGNVPFEGRTPQLSPAIKLGQEGLKLNKPVTIRIPHCATEAEGITSTDIYLGFSSNGEEIQWRKRKHHEPKPTLDKDHFEISVSKFCAISMNNAVDFRKPLSKRFRVLPLIGRIVNPTDDLAVTLWIYNDDETEHMHLMHEEINVQGKIQLHDFKMFILKGSEKDKEVDIKSGNNKITSHANINMKKVLSTTLWHNTRHALEFNFQNKEGIRDVSFRLRLCPRQLVRTVIDLQFDLKVMLPELLQKPQGSIKTLRGTHEPQPAMEKSFQELVSKLSGQLDVDTCLEIAGIFRLSSDLRDRVKKSSEPGKIIFDELIHEQLITAASVSALDVALTRTGNVHLAEDVKEYRHRFLTFPTTVFTLL